MDSFDVGTGNVDVPLISEATTDNRKKMTMRLLSGAIAIVFVVVVVSVGVSTSHHKEPTDGCYETDTDYPGNDLNLNITRYEDNLLYVLSPAACQRWCAQREGCKFFTWKQGSKECFLKTVGGYGKGHHEKGSISGPRFCDCPDGYDRKTGDTPGRGSLKGNIVVPDKKACSDLCNQEGGCFSFEYSNTEEICNLNTERYPVNNTHNYKDYQYCSKSQDGCYETDTDYPGNDLNPNITRYEDNLLYVLSPAACQELCTQREGCKFFTWKQGSKECWLKTVGGYGKGHHEKGSISGPRFCASTVWSKGLTYFGAVSGSESDAGTDDDISLKLSGGVNAQTCKTGVIWEGMGNNWLLGEDITAPPKTDCGDFEADGSPIGFTIVKPGNDSLKLVNMEFDIGGETYVWSGAAWWDPTHPVLMATWQDSRPCMFASECPGNKAQCQRNKCVTPSDSNFECSWASDCYDKPKMDCQHLKCLTPSDTSFQCFHSSDCYDKPKTKCQRNKCVTPSDFNFVCSSVSDCYDKPKTKCQLGKCVTPSDTTSNVTSVRTATMGLTAVSQDVLPTDSDGENRQHLV